MWLDIGIRLCGWTKSLSVSHVGVCDSALYCRFVAMDLVVVRLPVLKRRSLGRGDPKLSLLHLWGQSSYFFNFGTIRGSSVSKNYKVLSNSTRLSLRLKTLRVLCPSSVTLTVMCVCYSTLQWFHYTVITFIPNPACCFPNQRRRYWRKEKES